LLGEKNKMEIFKKLTDKNYWIHLAILVLAILLLKQTIVTFILKYISIEGIILDFVSMFVIVLFGDLILEEILNV